MKNLVLLMVVALASCGAQQPVTTAPAAPPPAPFYTYEVVTSYPHDTGAFTEGLFYRDGVMYESTGLEGKSDIRKVRLETGEVLQRRTLDAQYFGEGIIDWEGRLFELTWQSQKGFIYDLATFEPKGEFAYRGEGWALTRNDRFIIMTDGTADIRFLNPATLAEDHRITVTLNGRGVPQLNEVEWIRGELWANVWQTDFIVRIDPATGYVIGRVDLTGLLPAEERARSNPDVLNGIAYDAATDRIFVTGKNWPKLYVIKVKPRP